MFTSADCYRLHIKSNWCISWCCKNRKKYVMLNYRRQECTVVPELILLFFRKIVKYCLLLVTSLTIYVMHEPSSIVNSPSPYAFLKFPMKVVCAICRSCWMNVYHGLTHASLNPACIHKRVGIHKIGGIWFSRKYVIRCISGILCIWNLPSKLFQVFSSNKSHDVWMFNLPHLSKQTHLSLP